MAAIPNVVACAGVATLAAVPIRETIGACLDDRRKRHANTSPSEHQSGNNTAARASTPGTRASSPTLRNSLPPRSASSIDMDSSSSSNFALPPDTASTRESDVPRISYRQGSGLSVSIPGPIGAITAVGFLLWSLVCIHYNAYSM